MQAVDQKEKTNKPFSQLDVDNDGAIEASDIEDLAEGVLSGVGESASSPEGRWLFSPASSYRHFDWISCAS